MALPPPSDSGREGKQRGDRQRRRMRDLTHINHVATCPSSCPWRPAVYVNGLAGHVLAYTLPCVARMSQGGELPRTYDALSTSRVGLRVVLRGEEESRLALALAFMLGHLFVLTTTLPFVCGSDGGCSNRAVIRNRVGRGWELGDASRSSSTGNRIYRPVSSIRVLG